MDKFSKSAKRYRADIKKKKHGKSDMIWIASKRNRNCRRFCRPRKYRMQEVLSDRFVMLEFISEGRYDERETRTTIFAAWCYKYAFARKYTV